MKDNKNRKKENDEDGRRRQEKKDKTTRKKDDAQATERAKQQSVLPVHKCINQHQLGGKKTKKQRIVPS
jgi:hypothetical protein